MTAGNTYYPAHETLASAERHFLKPASAGVTVDHKKSDLKDLPVLARVYGRHTFVRAVVGKAIE